MSFLSNNLRTFCAKSTFKFVFVASEAHYLLRVSFFSHHLGRHSSLSHHFLFKLNLSGLIHSFYSFIDSLHLRNLGVLWDNFSINFWFESEFFSISLKFILISCLHFFFFVLTFLNFRKEIMSSVSVGNISCPA